MDRRRACYAWHMPDGLGGLLGSRKASMVLVVFLVLSGLVSIGRIPAEFLERFLEVVLPTWLGAHAVEEGARAFSRGGKARVPRAE